MATASGLSTGASSLGDRVEPRHSRPEDRDSTSSRWRWAITPRRRTSSASSAATSSTCRGWRHMGQDTSGCWWPNCASTDFNRQPSQKAWPQTVRTGCQNGSQQMGHVNSASAGSSEKRRSFFKSSSGASKRQIPRPRCVKHAGLWKLKIIKHAFWMCLSLRSRRHHTINEVWSKDSARGARLVALCAPGAVSAPTWVQAQPLTQRLPKAGGALSRNQGRYINGATLNVQLQHAVLTGIR